jgi:hypothetical protein
MARQPGLDTAESQGKRQFLGEWVRAVNERRFRGLGRGRCVLHPK